MDMLSEEWNRPGRYIQGPLYKASTLNLIGLLLGTFFAVISVFYSFSQVEAESDSGNTLYCGSLAQPAPRQSADTSFHAELLGYQSRTASSAPENELECIFARSGNSGPAWVNGLIAAGLLGTAALFIFGRDPEKNVWGQLTRGQSARPYNIGQPPVASQQPAGWYPDQADPALVRWFDGKQWTPATLPKPEESPEAAPETGPDIPPKRDGPWMAPGAAGGPSKQARPRPGPWVPPRA